MHQGLRGVEKARSRFQKKLASLPYGRRRDAVKNRYG